MKLQQEKDKTSVATIWTILTGIWNIFQNDCKKQQINTVSAILKARNAALREQFIYKYLQSYGILNKTLKPLISRLYTGLQKFSQKFPLFGF